MIDETLQKTVPFISSTDLRNNYSDYIILDARERVEYQISHLENAMFIGYNKINLDELVKTLPKNKTIVVYCTIGYRSEKIGELLLKKNYKVLNLYGGIFNWKNNDYTVVDSKSKITQKIHCYSKEWSNWLLKGEKVYE